MVLYCRLSFFIQTDIDVTRNISEIQENRIIPFQNGNQVGQDFPGLEKEMADA